MPVAGNVFIRVHERGVLSEMHSSGAYELCSCIGK